MAKAPDRGSFPLDHFHQCDQQAKAYSDCVSRHQLMPKRCRNFQIKYLQCRMKSGLMEHQQMAKLGFLQQNSWESQQAEKKQLFESIQKIKRQAWKTALQRQKKQFQKQRNINLKQVKLPQ